MGFDKIYGATQRQDGLTKIGRNKYEAIYGFGKDTMGNYNWREMFTKKPSVDTIRESIYQVINDAVSEKILSGYEWSGHKVWLSSENQFNYKAVYDLACKDSSVLPVKFKLSDGEDGKTVYYTFESLTELSAFYRGAITFINNCVNEGWTEKDNIDWSAYECED